MSIIHPPSMYCLPIQGLTSRTRICIHNNFYCCGFEFWFACGAIEWWFHNMPTPLAVSFHSFDSHLFVHLARHHQNQIKNKHLSPHYTIVAVFFHLVDNSIKFTVNLWSCANESVWAFCVFIARYILKCYTIIGWFDRKWSTQTSG